MPAGSPGGASGNDWWVVPEGFLGKLQNAFVVGPTLNLFTTKQSATQPKGATAGPYNTQAEAQLIADKLNAGQVATPGNIAKGAAQSIAGAWASSSIWIRVAESVLGLILIAIGLARITHAVPIATKVAKTAGAVALA